MGNDEILRKTKEFSRMLKENGYFHIIGGVKDKSIGFSIGYGTEQDIIAVLYAIIDRASKDDCNQFMRMCSILMETRMDVKREKGR